MTSTVDRLMFATSFEALLIRAYPELPASLVDRLRTLGVDLSKPFLPAYPLETWVRVLHVTAEEMHQGLPYQDALRTAGRQFIGGYFRTMLGKAVLQVLWLAGPLRSFRRMTQNLRGGNNFAETTLVEHSPMDVTLTVNHSLADDPNFMIGLLEEGLRLVRATDPTVKVVSVSPEGAVAYRASWAQG
jgi:uncharacterized protein (TIGR02265 family)